MTGSTENLNSIGQKSIPSPLAQPLNLSALDLRTAIIREPLTISPYSTVLDAILAMGGTALCCDLQSKTLDYQKDSYHGRRSSAVVVDADQRVVGLVTERDIVRLGAQRQPLDGLTVAQVMARPVITLRENQLTDLFAVVTLLQQHHIRHLPIVDDQQRLVGLLTHASLRQMTRPTDLLRLRSVAEVMTSAVVCVAPEDTLLTMAQLMAHHHVSSIIVVAPGGSTLAPQPVPIGLITERDLVQFQMLGLNLAAHRADAMMSTPVFTVGPEETLWTVQQMMGQHWIRRVVVTGDQGELLGIVTQTSLLRALNPLELYNLMAVLEDKIARLESEKGQLAAIVESSQDAIIGQSLDGLITTWNRAAEQLFGYPAEAAIGQPMTLIMSPEQRAIAIQMFQRLGQGKSIDTYETQHCHQAGHWIDVAVTLSPIYDLQGEVVGVSQIVRDISDQQAARRDRQRLETERQRPEANLRHINLVMEHAIEGISRLDAAGRHTTVNRAYAEICGYTPEELIGQPWQNTVYPPDIPEHELACQRLPHTGKVEFETRRCRKDGTLFYKQVILIADLKDPSQGGGHYCFIKDISDRKAAELALRQSEARYRHIVETTLEGVWGLDAEGLTTVVNQRMAEMLGYRVAEMGGRPLIDFMAPADRPQAQAYLERRRQGIEEQHSLRFQRRDGSPLWVIVSASLLQDEVGNFAGWVGLFTDITRAHRKQHPISIIMLDVDHFKRFNDTYGHDAGDYVLQRMSTLLQESVRGSDIVCRYGGEEFTIILPELSLQQAHSKAQDICTAITRLTLVFHQQPLGPITASLGVSVFPTHGTTGAALLQRADEALYRAKAAGRNQVVVAP